MFKLGWGHRTKNSEVCNAGGGTPHTPIEGILSNIQARVGTPHKILKCWITRGGTPHISFIQ